MKETQIAQIRMVLRPDPSAGAGPERPWQVVEASHESPQIPEEVAGFVASLQAWAQGIKQGGEGLLLGHKGRWSIIALGSADRVELIALKKNDFARHFAADPFRVASKVTRGVAFCSPGESPWSVDPAWGHFPSIDYFQDLLKSSDSALLLGGAQALMDGAKIQLDAGGEDGKVAERLWSLAPISVRLERSLVVNDPANAWRADLAALQPGTIADAWNSQRLGDYPEGRYELSLNTAIDLGDEATIYRLLNRQSPRQVMMMASFLLAGMILIGILMSW